MTPCFQLRLARTTTRFTCSQALCPRKLQTRDKNRFYIYSICYVHTHTHTLILNKMGKSTRRMLCGRWICQWVEPSWQLAKLQAARRRRWAAELTDGRTDGRMDGRLGVGQRVLDVVSDCDCAYSLRLSAHGVIPTCSMITSPSCCRVSSVLLLHRLNIFIASKLTEISKSTGNKYSTKMNDCRHVNPEIRRLKKNIYIEH